MTSMTDSWTYFKICINPTEPHMFYRTFSKIWYENWKCQQNVFIWREERKYVSTNWHRKSSNASCRFHDYRECPFTTSQTTELWRLEGAFTSTALWPQYRCLIGSEFLILPHLHSELCCWVVNGQDFTWSWAFREPYRFANTVTRCFFDPLFMQERYGHYRLPVFLPQY